MLPGVISPQIFAAPPCKAEISKFVKTPCPPISTAYSELRHAAKIVVPSFMIDDVAFMTY